MSEINIFEKSVSNVNFVENENGILLFLYTTFEVNTSDVRFYMDKEDDKMSLLLHFPSDNMIVVEIEDEDIYNKIVNVKTIKVFEIDRVDGEMVNYYAASK